jgi:hypothetical protein
MIDKGNEKHQEMAHILPHRGNDGSVRVQASEYFGHFDVKGGESGPYLVL